MKKFNDTFAALQTAQIDALRYFHTEALNELKENFGISVIGQEILILFREKRFNRQELFEAYQYDNTVPFGCLIPYDALSIGNVKVLCFDSLNFDKNTGNLKAPVSIKSFNGVGLNDYNREQTRVNDVVSLFNEILAFKSYFELVLSDGDDWHPGGQYLTRVSAPLHRPYEYEASEHLLEYFFGVNSTHKNYFSYPPVPYDRQQAREDNEEFEAREFERWG